MSSKNRTRIWSQESTLFFLTETFATQHYWKVMVLQKGKVERCHVGDKERTRKNIKKWGS